MCALCSRKYASDKTLLSHLRNWHFNGGTFIGGPRVWACGLCTIPVFGSIDLLLEHVANAHKDVEESCSTWDISKIMHNLLRQDGLKEVYKTALESERIPITTPIWKKTVRDSPVIQSLQNDTFTNPTEIVEQALRLAPRANIKHRFCQDRQLPAGNRSLTVETSSAGQVWPPVPLLHPDSLTGEEPIISPFDGSGTGSFYAGQYDYTGYQQ
jgi:hypothetical protein